MNELMRGVAGLRILLIVCTAMPWDEALEYGIRGTRLMHALTGRSQIYKIYIYK